MSIQPSDVDLFVVAAYEHIVANPGVPLPRAAERLSVPPADLERAVDLLRRLGLVRGEQPVAVSPETARAALLRPLDQAIRDFNRRLVDSLRWSRPFEEAFDRARHGTRPAVVCLDPREVDDRLAEAAYGCTTEVLVMQSCVTDEPVAARSARPLVLAAARRGVPVRLLYPHASRGHTATRAYLNDVTTCGGQVRTCDGVFDRFVVFDRTTAFILDSSVAVVDEPIVVGLLCRMHRHVWQGATSFVSPGPGYGEALDLLRSSIIGLLAAGLTDDAIARRVGMSERTLRRHIAALMREMSAESRFQAGVAAVRAGLVTSSSGHDDPDP